MHPQPPYPQSPMGGPQGYGPRGPSDDHMWAMLAYVLTLVAAIIAPLVVYLVKMNESRYVRFHAAQSLNLGITALIYSAAIFVLSLTLGLATNGLGILLMFPLMFALGIADLVFLILGAVRAGQGELYRIPPIVCLRLVS